MQKLSAVVFSLALFICPTAMAQSPGQSSQSSKPQSHAATDTRLVSGTIVSQQNESVNGVTVVARFASGEQRTTSDAEGSFSLTVPREPVTLKFEGKNISSIERTMSADEATEKLQIKVDFVVEPIHESVVIVATQIDPAIERRNNAIYKNTLFGRDDQLLFTLNGGINAGQHEGGGKSLEVRRFGYNLDHGGVNGGLKILVDDIQQNQGTQGHGQGYLGSLKSLTPELVEDVDIINGPFSAQYGDFSGLGVVHIRQKEFLPHPLTLRLQGGSFDTFRTFVAYSPALTNAASFIAYEGSRSDGPFLSPLRYRRDNLTGNYTQHLGERETLGFKLNVARNSFFSSGQIPLDEVAAGRLDRFGFIDPDNGGRVRSGTLGAYYRKEGSKGNIFKLDGFVSRSLFDLFSNFTFFLTDEEFGDEIQQHDSRLQEGVNAQYLHPYQLFGQQALFTAGGNFHDNQINVGLYPSIGRNPVRAAITRSNLNDCGGSSNPDVPGLPGDSGTPCFLLTDARAHVTNAAGYVQQGIDLFRGRVHLEGGLRYDYFRFRVDDIAQPTFSGVRGGARLQPKATISYTPSDRVPATLYFNYGRGIASQDARGVVRNPVGPTISTTDFYQLGTSHNTKQFSLSTALFFIDQSNQQVYIPDDGSIEFAGPSRTYGFEAKISVQINRYLALSGGLTQVGNAFYRSTRPRIYVDSAPHRVANAGLTFSGYRGFTSSLRYRHISNYRLDGEDAQVRAAGHDVLDFSLAKRIRPWMDFNLSIDNLTNKRYFETQNYFESRLRPGDEVISRIHGTPGYPFGVTVGFTFHLFGEK